MILFLMICSITNAQESEDSKQAVCYNAYLRRPPLEGLMIQISWKSHLG